MRKCIHTHRRGTDSSPTGQHVEHIFVYGTLRNRARAERRLLSQHGVRLGVGQVASASLFLGEYPYAVPDKSAERPLIGEVYRLDQAQLPHVLSELDTYEEFDPNDIKGSLYRREVTTVSIGTERIRAWIYWYNQPLGNTPLVRHGNYLRSQLHVLPSGTGWQVKMAGAIRASDQAPRKAEAVKKARKLAGKNRLMLVIHGRDGRIQERIPAVKE